MKTIFLASVILLSGLVQGQTQLWQTLIDTSVTFSSPRAVKLNGDSILDVVIGGGIDGSPDERGVVALDGANGNVLWEFATDDEMFSSAAFGDANGDGEKDIFIGGRNGEFYAIDGQTGSMIWEFFPYPASQAADSGWLNFYSPQIISDQNGDLVADILVANGGDHAALPWDTLRPPGRLMILDALTGNIIAQDTMPDGEETYCSAVCIDMNNTGVYSVIFGSGGEDDGGSLWRVPLLDLMNNDISGATMLIDDPVTGFIAPVSLADINYDGVYDIVSQSFSGTIYAIDGLLNTILWEVTIPGAQSSAAPIFGNFTGNQSPDVFAVLGKGSAPSYFDYYQVMIDGNTGEVAFFDSISDLNFASANAADLDLNGRDEVILSVNYHTGTHFEHQLKIVDFPNNSISDLSLTEAGVNLGSTPLITDLDGNGFIDFVYAFRADSVNPMGAKGFKLARIEGTYTNPGPGIAWGSYMGNDYNGIYNFEVTNCGTINLNLIVNNTSCNYWNDGNALVSPTGGTEPYAINWSSGQITDSIGSLSPDNYSVYVVDSVGCLKSTNFNIVDPYVLTWGGVGTPTCPGDSNATATLASSGCPCMFSGCIYDWASIDSLKVANYLWAGWQVVTITHLDGCQVTDSIFIEEAYPILDSLNFGNIQCATDTLGYVNLHLHDSANVSIGWADGSHESSIDSLSAGWYYYQLIDNRGCNYYDSVQITTPDALIANYSMISPLCFGDANGSILGSAVGGTGGYSFAWSNSDTLALTDSLIAGYYNLVVTDSTGCTFIIDSINLSQPDILALNTDGWNSSSDSCMASAEVTVSGGTSGYSYSWNDATSATTFDVHELCAGTYIITVTDANGCESIDSVTVSSTVGLATNENINVSVFPNPSNGNIQLNGLRIGQDLEIFKMTGKLVYSDRVGALGITLNLSRLTSGKYFIRISDLSGYQIIPISIID